VSDELRSILIGTAGLSVAGVMALGLAIVRVPRPWNGTSVGPTVRLAEVAVPLQAAHFIEEFGTGFYQRFPELLGVAPWPLRFFVSRRSVRPADRGVLGDPPGLLHQRWLMLSSPPVSRW
jgi:hypothetical protein